MNTYLLEWRNPQRRLSITYVTNDALWCTRQPSPRGDCTIVEANRHVLKGELGEPPVYHQAKTQPERPRLVFIVESNEEKPPPWFILDDGRNVVIAIQSDLYREQYAERFEQEEVLDDEEHARVAHEAMVRALDQAVKEFVSYRVPEWWQEIVEEILDRSLEEALFDAITSRANEEGWMFLWKGDQLDVPLEEALQEALDVVTLEALDLEPTRFRAFAKEKGGALPVRLLKNAPPLVSRTFYV